MAGIDTKKILVIVTNYGIEQDELVVPVAKLKEAGAHVTVAAVENATIACWYACAAACCAAYICWGLNMPG